MTDDEARAKVAEYMGWTRCNPDEPIAEECWHDAKGLAQYLPTFDDTPEGWWEFGQLVAAWERDGFDIDQRRTPLGWYVRIYAVGGRIGFWHANASSLPEAAYRATVKMLEGRDE